MRVRRPAPVTDRHQPDHDCALTTLKPLPCFASFLSAPQLKVATERAVIWRTADISTPTYLTDEQRNLARHGFDKPLDTLEAGVIPLPSERAACIATLTPAEAHLARWSLLVEIRNMVEELSDDVQDDEAVAEPDAAV